MKKKTIANKKQLNGFSVELFLLEIKIIFCDCNYDLRTSATEILPSPFTSPNSIIATVSFFAIATTIFLASAIDTFPSPFVSPLGVAVVVGWVVVVVVGSVVLG